MSPQENKIYRHAKTLGGYSIGVDYLANTNIDLSKSVSITIAETVFVLDAGGKVMQFTRGSEIPFNIKNMPTSLEKPTIIFAKPGFTNIYIVDPKKKGIVVIDNNGNYKGQYVSDSFKNIKGIIADETNKKCYLLSENKVYSFDLTAE